MFQKFKDKHFLISFHLFFLNFDQKFKLMRIGFQYSRQLILDILIIFNLQQQSLNIFFSFVTNGPLTLTLINFCNVEPLYKLSNFFLSLLNLKQLLKFGQWAILLNTSYVKTKRLALSLYFIFFVDCHSVIWSINLVLFKIEENFHEGPWLILQNEGIIEDFVLVYITFEIVDTWVFKLERPRREEDIMRIDLAIFRKNHNNLVSQYQLPLLLIGLTTGQ